MGSTVERSPVMRIVEIRKVEMRIFENLYCL
jgi:hypothetical protein